MRTLFAFLTAALCSAALGFGGFTGTQGPIFPYGWTETSGKFTTAGSANCLLYRAMIQQPLNNSTSRIMATEVSGSCMNFGYARTTTPLSGKVYAEFKVTARASANKAICFGVVDGGSMTKGCNAGAGNGSVIRPAIGGSCGISTGGFSSGTSFTTNAAYTFTLNDVVQIAFDTSSHKIWYGKNGTWLSGGDPGADTSPTTTISGGSTFYFYVTSYCDIGPTSGTYSFDIIPAAADQTYAAPTGYSAYQP